MALTNTQIIEAYKVANNIPLATPLFTYAAWKAQGFQVRKGEASRHKIQMWKHTQCKQKADTEVQEAPQGHGRCFMKTVYLFEREQVERIV